MRPQVLARLRLSFVGHGQGVKKKKKKVCRAVNVRSCMLRAWLPKKQYRLCLSVCRFCRDFVPAKE